jgi:hypothetical protein
VSTIAPPLVDHVAQAHAPTPRAAEARHASDRAQLALAVGYAGARGLGIDFARVDARENGARGELEGREDVCAGQRGDFGEEEAWVSVCTVCGCA